MAEHLSSSGWRRRLDPSSLRTKLVLLVGLLVCLLTGPLLVLLPRHNEDLSRRWAESRSVGIARLLSAATEAAVDFDDPVAAEAALRKLDGSRGAVWAVLLRADGVPLARWRDPPTGVEPCRRRDEEHVDFRDDLIVVRVPVEARMGEPGTLALAFDLAELRARLAETHRWLGTAAVLMLLAGIAAAFVIGTLVTHPLRRMTRVAERIAEGDLSASRDLQIGRRDEAGALARAFERMLARLYEHQSALARTNEELAEKLAELKRTQEQLVSADRRISVGRLAAGVAHEVNNPLAYVMANLRFAARTAPGVAAAALDPAQPRPSADVAAELQKALAEASQGAGRIRSIVKSLKSFSRDDDDRRLQLELQAPLEAAVAMAAHEVKQRARLERRYGAVPLVLASEVRISQVFLNLLLNAAQAIPEGDSEHQVVTVSTGTSPDGWAVVEVTDTGCGIAPEHRAKLFEPFFTTKPVGVGTGLGLSISNGIIQAHGGRIEVDSTVGRGTTFRVLLPPGAPGAAEAAPSPSEGVPPPAVRTTLLVVDDEPLVGTALERALGDRYRVVALSSAGEALRRLAQERFEHVLCDVMMPDLNGAAFHAEVARRDPDLARRLIFMTGGTFTPVTEKFLATWTGGLLEKPLDFDRLRRLLDAPR